MSVLRNAATALLGLAALSTLSVSPTVAQAGERERSFVYGAVAGAAGAALLNGLANDRYGPVTYERRVYRPAYRPVYRVEPIYRPVYRTVRYRPAYRALPGRHVAYCQGRYRSYDIGSNTFQPNHGPRRACLSPYG